MTAASAVRGPAALLAVTAGAALAACTAAPEPSRPSSAPVSSGATTTGSSTPAPRPPLPTSPAPSVLPSMPAVQLAPVSSSPDDLGRIDIRNGSTRNKEVVVELPASAGYTVTAGCLGPAGTLLHYRLIGTSEADDGFLFGSTTPCNGRFITDAALANIDERTPARLEVTLDAGVEAATVVLRSTPTDPHL